MAHPAQQTAIDIKPDLLSSIPDWVYWGTFAIGALFIFAAILRFTPAGKYWKLFWKTWHNVAGDK